MINVTDMLRDKFADIEIDGQRPFTRVDGQLFMQFDSISVSVQDGFAVIVYQFKGVDIYIMHEPSTKFCIGGFEAKAPIRIV